MRFSEFALYLGKMEKTSSRNALVGILAELFARTPPEDVVPTCYLLQGRLAPFFEPVEIGLGQNYLADAVARAYGGDREHVLARFDELGDLGDATAALAAASPRAARPEDASPVREVFDMLLGIAKTSGAGSVRAKVETFASLLAGLDPLSVRYLCRIPLDSLRLRIGDPTVLNGFSFSKVGDRSLRKRLECAYNETSDLGLVGRTLWEGGVEEVDALGVRVGNPVRPALAERLPSAEAIPEKLGTCAVEGKYDGFRCQVHKSGEQVKIFSRGLEDLTGIFPEIAEGARRQVSAGEAILEGEAFAYNPLSEEYLPLQQTVRSRRKHSVEEAARELPLRLFAFDVLYADGGRIMDRHYTERHVLLGQMVADGEILLVSESRTAQQVEDLEAVFEESVQDGLEGVVATRDRFYYTKDGRFWQNR